MPTDRTASPDGQLAGRYVLGRLLGRGGAGVVREGEDTLLRRRVAIKELRRPIAASQAEAELFNTRVLREARAAARLRHPGLVTVYDVINAEDRTWIVMEYVDGSSLAELIRAQGRLAPLRAARIGVSLAYALEAAHRSGVVHRDVKPGNVLVGSDGQARLTDFGIAVSEGDASLTETGMLVGSPAYIPPERARGSRVGTAGDVWGLGATLFTAVEGVPPFEGDGTLAVLAAVVQDRRRPFRYSGPLRGVLTDLLAADPARRPTLAAARGRLREIADRLAEQSRDGGDTLQDIPQPPPRRTARHPISPPDRPSPSPDRPAPSPDRTAPPLVPASSRSEAVGTPSAATGGPAAVAGARSDAAGVGPEVVGDPADVAATVSKPPDVPSEVAGSSTDAGGSAPDAVGVLSGPRRGTSDSPSVASDVASSTSDATGAEAGPGPVSATSVATADGQAPVASGPVGIRPAPTGRHADADASFDPTAGPTDPDMVSSDTDGASSETAVGPSGTAAGWFGTAVGSDVDSSGPGRDVFGSGDTSAGSAAGRGVGGGVGERAFAGLDQTRVQAGVVRGPASRPGGDDRQRRRVGLAGIVAAVLMAVGLTVGLIFWLDGSSDDTVQPQPVPKVSPTATVSAAASPRVSPSASPSRAAPTGSAGRSVSPSGGGGGAGTATGGSTSAAPVNPGQQGGGDDLGTLVPNSTRPAAAPSGYRSLRDGTGWSVALPVGWSTSGGGSRLVSTGPGGYPDLLVEVRDKAGPSAIDAWRELEPAVRSSSQGYRRVAIEPADGGSGANAATWEFTFTSGGRTIHVLDLGVVRNGHGYALRWRVPEADWAGSRDQLRTIVASFRPGP